MVQADIVNSLVTLAIESITTYLKSKKVPSETLQLNCKVYARKVSVLYAVRGKRDQWELVYTLYQESPRLELGDFLTVYLTRVLFRNTKFGGFTLEQWQSGKVAVVVDLECKPHLELDALGALVHRGELKVYKLPNSQARAFSWWEAIPPAFADTPPIDTKKVYTLFLRGAPGVAVFKSK